MKKRYIAGLALALVGILSGCGQVKMEAPDNTISITPVAQTTNAPQVDTSVNYEFTGNNIDVSDIDFEHYTWNGAAWEKDGCCVIVPNLEKIGEKSGTIRFELENNAVNSEYIIVVQIENFNDSGQIAELPESKLSSLSTEWLTSAVAMQEEKIADLVAGVEIPLLVRTLRTDGTQILVSIDAFADTENSSAVKYSSYAEAYTVKFLKNDNLLTRIR